MKVGDCMPFDATCPRALPYPDVVTSVPFTFRDGLTTLELIERLRHYIGHIQKDMNEITRQLLDDIKANRESIDALLEQYQEDYKSTIERWLGDNLPQYVYDLRPHRRRIFLCIYPEKMGAIHRVRYGGELQ